MMPTTKRLLTSCGPCPTIQLPETIVSVAFMVPEIVSRGG